MKKIAKINLKEGEVCVAIVHYNTPELTHACIGSLVYNSGLADRLRIVVFDNSDRKPFPEASGVSIIDNTHGDYINFEDELAKYPERDRSIGCSKGCEFGSVKHMMTVQLLWQIIPQGFILMESDIFIKKPITDFVRPEFSFVGYAQKAQPQNPFNIGRVLPMLCWMNVPLFAKYGVKYFDPTRAYGLLPGGRNNRNNWYDTGASLLEDIIAHKPHLRGLHLDIRQYIEHYGSASWINNDEDAHNRWIEQMNRYLPDEETRKRIAEKWGWTPADIVYENDKIAVCAIGRLENRYAVEWVEHYSALGVDKIFLYDNNRIEDGELLADVLQPYIDAGLVEIKYWRGLQKQAYEDCYNLHNQDYDWIGFFDFDELLRISMDRKLPEFLQGFQRIDCDVVVINWRTMTDNGLAYYDPRPMAERFTEATGTGFAINRHVKCFVHSGVRGISFNDPHCPNAPQLHVVNVLGEQVEQKPIQPKVIHNFAWIDHYNTKSAEEYINVKWKRGTCCGDEWTAEKRKKCVEYFFGINTRTPKKEAILAPLMTDTDKIHKQPPKEPTQPAQEPERTPKRLSKPATKKRANNKNR